MGKPFKPGRKKTGGRKPGSKNKVTLAFREAVQACFGDIGGGKAFAAWAKKNRTEFYKIAARLIPTELVGDGGGPLEIRVKSF
jgi:hypothetical protein